MTKNFEYSKKQKEILYSIMDENNTSQANHSDVKKRNLKNSDSKTDNQPEVVNFFVDWKKEIGQELANDIRIGNTAFDRYKLKKYETLLEVEKEQEEKSTAIEKSPEENNELFAPETTEEIIVVQDENVAIPTEPSIKPKKNKVARKIKKELSSLKKTETAYTAIGWYNSIRLSISRTHQLLNNYGLGFLPSFYKIFGLFYLVELIFDIGVVAWSTFRPLSEEEKKYKNDAKLNWFQFGWKRFKNVMLKDNRIPRMLNATVWLAFNLTAIILSGGLSATVVAPATTLIINKINLAGSIFDFCMDTYKLTSNLFYHVKTVRNLNKEIEELKEELRAPRHELDIHIKFNSKNINRRIEELADRVKNIENKIESRELVKAKLKRKIYSEIVPKVVWGIAIGVVLLVGAGLILFPPTSFAGVALITGAVISLVCGSVLNGLGKRIWDKTGGRIKSSDLKFDGSAKQSKNSYTTHCKFLVNNECDMNNSFRSAAAQPAPSKRSDFLSIFGSKKATEKKKASEPKQAAHPYTFGFTRILGKKKESPKAAVIDSMRSSDISPTTTRVT